ncbi:MAG TPA: hypothetical protein VFY67_05575 [Pyrinomonadaceae bacterium]|nr:hypothetical protein [Pyrinomonadaceae bacterium]
MKTAFLKSAAFILVLYAAAGLVTNSQTTNKPTGDIKIRQRMTMGGGATETILYIKGQRMRNEMASAGMGLTTILQCDLKRTLTINEKTKTYMISPTGGANTSGAGDGGPVAPTTSTPVQPQSQPRGGIVNVTNTVTDTGERKQMFGFTARHIKTSIETKASPDACAKDMKMETDGWYIDFDYAFACPGETQKHQQMPVQPRPGCKDDVRTRTVGTAKLGFPLLVTTTIYQPDGSTTSMTQEVIELSREQLSASLFDIPEGYTLAKDMQELYGMSTAATMTPSTSSRPSESSNTTSSATTTTSATAEKKPGVIRIGLVLPKVQVTAGDTAQSAEAVRNSFASRLNAPGVEVVTLNSASASEARQKQCDYMLSVSMTVKKGGGGSRFGRAIGNIAGAAAGHIPGGSTAGTAAARSATIAGVHTAAIVADNIKAKDELTLDYRVDRTDSPNTVLADTAKAKAKSDGEDILTPQVDKAAQAILAAIKK